MSRQTEVPIERKFMLNIEEAIAYFGIGEKKLRSILADHNELCIQNGTKYLVKRTLFEEFLTKTTTI